MIRVFNARNSYSVKHVVKLNITCLNKQSEIVAVASGDQLDSFVIKGLVVVL